MKTNVEKIIVDAEDMYTGTRPKNVWVRNSQGQLMWRRLKKVLESNVRVLVMPIELVDELLFDLERLERELAWFRVVNEFKVAHEMMPGSFTNEMKKEVTELRNKAEDDRINREIWLSTMAHDPESLAVYARTLLELRENEKRELKKLYK